MGMFTSDNKNTETTSIQDNDSYAVNQQGNTSPVSLAGLTVGGGGGVLNKNTTNFRLSVLDGGAIPLARDVALSVIDLGKSIFSTSAETIQTTTEQAQEITASALQRNEEVSLAALGFVDNMSRSDDAQNIELLIKVMGAAVIGGFLLYGYKVIK